MNDASSSGTLVIVPGTSDREMADRLRERLRSVLKPVLEVVDDATRAGLVMGFTLARDPFGRAIIQEITINKPY